jgi:hypothetical protein
MLWFLHNNSNEKKITIYISQFNKNLILECITLYIMYGNKWDVNILGIKLGHDCMVVGFITTYAISAYHH